MAQSVVELVLIADGEQEFVALFGLIGAYLHQDMDLDFDSVPEAVAGYARETDAGLKQQLLRDMKRFLELYPDKLPEEFARRYGFDFTPDLIGQTVPEFFAMVRDIVQEPAHYSRYLPAQ